MAVVKEGLQSLSQAHDPRRLLGIENVEIERHPYFQLARPEERLHQHLRVDVAALGLQHQTNVRRRLVLDVAKQRQLARLQ